MRYQNTSTIFLFVCYVLIHNAQGFLINLGVGVVNLSFNYELSQGCPNTKLCESQWGFCGTGNAYCGEGCRSGPCTTSRNIINKTNFACAFKNLDDETRTQRLDGLNESGWKPLNAGEAAVFLAHVSHESAGLTTLVEFCAPGCGPDYILSWCGIPGAPGKFYYGRGWFQLSYPCNYYEAGMYLGLDLLNNPDLVSQRQDVAVGTAVWFFRANNMTISARRGDFAGTTRIINSIECDGGPGAVNQNQRVEIYKAMRICFGLGEPKVTPTC